MKFYPSKNGVIEFKEVDGQLWFAYLVKSNLSENSYREFFHEGEVPNNIIAKGHSAIAEYAKKQVRISIDAQRKKAKEFDDFAKNPNFPISTTSDGQPIQGRIRSAWLGDLVVELEHPYQGIISIHFGYASALSGRHIFAGPGEFTGNAIETAKGLLKKIYQREKHKATHGKLIQLAEELNEDN